MARKVLKKEWRDKIINDYELQGKIAKATFKSAPSIKRWAILNHEMLLLDPLLQTIREYYSLPADTILTEEIKAEPATK